MTGDPFEALGDPQRRAIVELLRGGERSVQEHRRRAADQPPGRLAPPAPAQGRGPRGRPSRSGTRRLYRLHDEGIEAVQAYLEQVWGEAAARFRLAAENTAGRPMTEPLRLSFDVACPPEHAFSMWADRTSLWWPPATR